MGVPLTGPQHRPLKVSVHKAYTRMAQHDFSQSQKDYCFATLLRPGTLELQKARYFRRVVCVAPLKNASLNGGRSPGALHGKLNGTPWLFPSMGGPMVWVP